MSGVAVVVGVGLLAIWAKNSMEYDPITNTRKGLI